MILDISGKKIAFGLCFSCGEGVVAADSEDDIKNWVCPKCLDFQRIYHGTSQNRLTSILSEGIKPGKQHNWFHSKERVYVSTGHTARFDAAYFARKAASNTGSLPAIVEARVPREYFDKNSSRDPFGGVSTWTLPEIKREWITHVYGIE